MATAGTWLIVYTRGTMKCRLERDGYGGTIVAGSVFGLSHDRAVVRWHGAYRQPGTRTTSTDASARRRREGELTALALFATAVVPR